MRHLAVLVIAVAALLGAFSPIIIAYSAGDNGHTQVTLCHWVPAHGGSFITITVDDDGSSGNGPLQAHLAHENDIIPAPDGGCDQQIPATTTNTPTLTPTHDVPNATPTNTPLTDIGDPVFVTPSPCAKDEVHDEQTGECIHIDRILLVPTETAPITLPSTGIGAD